MSQYLNGRSAIVTGAGRGIGREVALLLARQGAKVVVNDPGFGRNGEVTTERPADEVVAEIQKAGGQAVANYDSVEDGHLIIETAQKAFGTVQWVSRA